MRDKQESNINFRQPEPAKVTKLTGGGLFQEYDYTPTPYNAFLKKKQEEREENLHKQRLVHDKPFVLGMDIYKCKSNRTFNSNPFFCL